ncbi:MAG TPA: HupE/UreJ family protein [Kofleriaceae bacterium]|nr:HupE/UreJ family protein [Kofleriaceae bacterium]
MTRRWLIAAGVAGALLPAGRAAAHQGSITYLDAHISEDRARVDLRLRIDVRDTLEPLGLDRDQPPDAAAIAARGPDLLAYVLDKVTVEGDDQDCTDIGGAVAVASGFAEVTWSVSCPQPIEQLAIEYDLFFDIDPLHTCNLVVYRGDERAIAPLQADTSRFEWNLRAAPPGAFVPFLRLGIHHILSGFDHLSFLLGLLLIAVIAAERSRLPSASGGYGGVALRVRGVVPAIRYTAVIATSFTLAHSITLALAALGWVTLPSRLVESAVAASIVYVAVENLVRPEPTRRWMLTFAFGLCHGLAFASNLRAQLPPTDVLWPLLAFNAGVELGQLAVIVVTVPILHLLAARILGPQRYRALFVTTASAVIALLGLIWLLERALAVKILGL